MVYKAKIGIISCITLMTAFLPASWAEETFTQLSRRQKIGQLFMIAVTANPDAHFFLSQSPYRMQQQYCEKLITEYQVGGIIFLGTSSLEQQIRLTRHYQSLSALPLLVGIDAEWGLKMRIHNGMRFPHAMALGAIQNEELIYQTGYTIGKQCKALGIHITFSPVLDVATNPENPIISHRSFGQDPQAVARKGMRFAHGLQDAGIIACAKHFPGHGDTNTDSHHTLPYVTHTQERLKTVELLPFAHAIQQGIPAIMTAHIAVPALDYSNSPASMSAPIIKELLQDQLGFTGLTSTDGLGMAGAKHNDFPGQTEYTAFCAGNDLLLCPTDVPQAVQLIEQAIESGAISEHELDCKVRKILQAKEWAFQHRADNAPALPATQLQKELYFNAITLLKNDNQSIPLTAHKPVATITFGCTSENIIGQELQAERAHSATYNLTAQPTVQELKNLETQISSYDTIIIGIFNMNHYKDDQFGIHDMVYAWIQNMNTEKKVILALFGTPYSLALFGTEPAIIMAYEDTPETQYAVAHTIAGIYTPTGKLPISINAQFPCGAGI